MSRPSSHADTLMIDAAKEIARKRGLSGLTIREVVSRAGVNLGMFHYYFKTRQRFDQRVLKELYGEFFSELTMISEGEGSAFEQLRASLILMGRFFRDHRRIAVVLLKDCLNGKREVLGLSKKKVPPHAEVLMRLLMRCEKQKSLPSVPAYVAMPLLFGAISLPAFVSEVLESSVGKSWFPAEEALSDRAIERRVDVVLSGLKVTKL